MKKLTSMDQAQGKVISTIIQPNYNEVVMIFDDKSFLRFSSLDWSEITEDDEPLENMCLSECGGYENTIIEKEMKVLYDKLNKESIIEKRNREEEELKELKLKVVELRKKLGK